MQSKIANMYRNGEIGKNELLKAVSKRWITAADATGIAGEENAFGLIQSAKLAEISAACNAVIVAGVDLEFNGETVHFNLSIEDQSNIANLFRVVELGGSEFPYQADGGVCRIYSAAEIAQIYIAAQTLITTQTTYHNTLKAYVQTLTTVEELETITYGMDLPEEYAVQMAEKLAVAQTQMDAIVAKLGG